MKKQLKHWPRNCPLCDTTAFSVQSLATCKACGIFFKADQLGRVLPNSYVLRKKDKFWGNITSHASDEGIPREWEIDSLEEDGKSVTLLGNNSGPEVSPSPVVFEIAEKFSTIEKLGELIFEGNYLFKKWSGYLTYVELLTLVFYSEKPDVFRAFFLLQIDDACPDKPWSAFVGNGHYEIHLEFNSVLEFQGVFPELN